MQCYDIGKNTRLLDTTSGNEHLRIRTKEVGAWAKPLQFVSVCHPFGCNGTCKVHKPLSGLQRKSAGFCRILPTRKFQQISGFVLDFCSKMENSKYLENSGMFWKNPEKSAENSGNVRISPENPENSGIFRNIRKIPDFSGKTQRRFARRQILGFWVWGLRSRV